MVIAKGKFMNTSRIWIFENLSNYGKGGSLLVENAERRYAESLAHERLRGWYQSVKYWNGKRYQASPPSYRDDNPNMETHYFKDDKLVGKVYAKKTVLEEKTDFYYVLASNVARNDEEERVVHMLQDELQSEGVRLGFDPLPRE